MTDKLVLVSGCCFFECCWCAGFAAWLPSRWMLHCVLWVELRRWARGFQDSIKRVYLYELVRLGLQCAFGQELGNSPMHPGVCMRAGICFLAEPIAACLLIKVHDGGVRMQNVMYAGDVHDGK